MDDSLVVAQPAPWKREGPMTRCLMHDAGINGKSRFHVIDVWHMLHLGVGKCWLASAFMLLQSSVEGENIDERLDVLSAEYRQYCRQSRLDPVIRKFDRYSLGGGGSNEASGTWNKASVTSNLLLYLEDHLNKNRDKIKGNQLLEIVVPALYLTTRVCPTFAFNQPGLFLLFNVCLYVVLFLGGPFPIVYPSNHVLSRQIEAVGTRNINSFMRGIYHESLFIPSSKGKELCAALLAFIKAYVCLASLCHKKVLPYFALFPKLHFLHEVQHTMSKQCAMASHCFNVAAASCSVDEDLVGRIARLTRCVSPRACALRTLQRYLTHVQLAWSRV